MAKNIYVPEAGRVIAFKDTASDADIKTYLNAKYPKQKAAPAPAAPVAAPEGPGLWESAGLGYLSRMQTAAGGVAEGIEGLLGDGGWADYFYDKAQKNLDEANKYQGSRITGADTYGEMATGIGEAFVQSSPDMAQGLAGAYAGGVAGASAGSVVPGIGTVVGGIAGSLIGGGIAAYPSLFGANIQEQAEEQGVSLKEADAGTAAVAAAAQAPLEALADRIMLGRLIPKGKVGALIVRGAESAVGKMAKAGATEGVTETLQQAIQIGQANPEKLFDLPPEVQQELADAAIVGLGLGAGVRGAVMPFEKMADARRQEPFKQLNKDLGLEAKEGVDAAKRAEVERGAAALAENNAIGDLDLTTADVALDPSQPENKRPVYTVSSKGKKIADFSSMKVAEEAVKVYKDRTNTSVQIKLDKSDAFSQLKPTSTNLGAAFSSPDSKIGQRIAEREAPTNVPFKGGLSGTVKMGPSTDQAIPIGDKFLKPEEIKSQYETLAPQQDARKDMLKRPERLEANSMQAGIDPADLRAELRDAVKEDAPVLKELKGPYAEIARRAPQNSATDNPFTMGGAFRTGPSPKIELNESPAPSIFPKAKGVPYEKLDRLAPSRNLPPVTPDEIAQLGNISKSYEAPNQPGTLRAKAPGAVGFKRPGEEIKPPEWKGERQNFPRQPSDAPLQRSGDINIAGTPRPTDSKLYKEYEKQYAARKRVLEDNLKSRLKGLGVADFELNLVSYISGKDVPDPMTGRVVYGNARTEGSKVIIDLAMDIYDPSMTVDQLVKKIGGVMNHELVHGLVNAGLLTRREMDILVRATRKPRPGKKYSYFDRAYQTYKDVDGYDIPAIEEEAVAEMYREWVADPKAAEKEVRGLLNRILQFFRRLFSGFKAASANDVFKRIESGDVGGRVRSFDTSTAGTSFSISPEADERTRVKALRDSQWGRYFGGERIDNILDMLDDPENRVTLVSMSPDDYLKLATHGLRNPGQERVYAENMRRGMKLNLMPMFTVQNDKDGETFVTGHEGRHRAAAFKRMGFKKMPVMIVHETYRWGSQKGDPPGITLTGQPPVEHRIYMPDSIITPRTFKGTEDLNELLAEGRELSNVSIGLAPAESALDENAKLAMKDDPPPGGMSKKNIKENIPAYVPRGIALMAKPIEAAATEAGATTVYNTSGMGVYGGNAIEPTSTLEAIVPEEKAYEVANAMAIETFKVAKENDQWDAFVAVRIPPEQWTEPYARPGITMFFYPKGPGETARTISQIKDVIKSLPGADAIGGFTAIASQRATNSFAGVEAGYEAIRFIWVPEYAGVQPADIPSNFDATLKAMNEIVEFVENKRIASATIDYYDLSLGSKDNYDQRIKEHRELRTSGSIGEAGGNGPWRQSVGESVSKRLGKEAEWVSGSSLDVQGARKRFSIAPAPSSAENKPTTPAAIARDGGGLDVRVAPDDNTGSSSVYLRRDYAPVRFRGGIKQEEIGRAFDRAFRAQFGRVFDITNQQDFDHIVDSIADEIRHQMSQAQSGVGWYDSDIQDVFDELGKSFPILKDPYEGPVYQRMFTVIAGVMSNGMKAKANVELAAINFAHFLNTGRFSEIHPFTQIGWNQRSNIMGPQIAMLNSMINDPRFAPRPGSNNPNLERYEKFIRWAFEEHSVREINQFRAQHGTRSPAKIGGVDTRRLGIYAFGPKFGPFILNLNGYSDETVDSWASRSFYRHMGKSVDEAIGKMNDAPRGPADREAMKAALREVANKTQLSSRDIQAVLWFYEKELYNHLGKTIPLEVFSDGAREFTRKYGRGAQGPSQSRTDRERSIAGSIDQASTRYDATPERRSPVGGQRRRFSLSPNLPEMESSPYVESQRDRYFAPTQIDAPILTRAIRYFFGDGYTRYTELSDGTKFSNLPTALRVQMVDTTARVRQYERKRNRDLNGVDDRFAAQYSAWVSLQMAQRSAHVAAASLRKGAPIIKTENGDINSAYVDIEDGDGDNFVNFIKLLSEGVGPGGEKMSLMNIFRDYSLALRGKRLDDSGKEIPFDPQWVREALAAGRAQPKVLEAHAMYQRYNKKLMKAVRDAGVISDAEFSIYTGPGDYYGFYREIGYDTEAPRVGQKVAGKIRVLPYKGSQLGSMINDPMVVMVHNINFWTGAIMRNIAAQKTYNLLESMGEARVLPPGSQPDPNLGEDPEIMYFRKDGVTKAFAVKDYLLAKALGSDESLNAPGWLKLLGMPANILRETVTRDPRFVVANLIRDTMSTWILRGESIVPFVDSIKGMKGALMESTSYNRLDSFGVVGGYDEASLSPDDMSARLKQRARGESVLDIAHPKDALRAGWHFLGKLSDASDAASRIPVFDSVLAETGNEYEAAFRALEVMNFSRHGASTALRYLTKVIPFLNARIQGFDVLYQGVKTAGLAATGKADLSAKDARLGRRLLVRGLMLAAVAMALEQALSDDEDYQELPDYIKTGNILIPMGKDENGKGQYFAVPKPFEAGFLFATIPQHVVRHWNGSGDFRDDAKVFTEQFASTFGLNPIPQAFVPLAENAFNYDMFTGMPLVSAGDQRLDPSLRYNSNTSKISRMLGEIPISYNTVTGRWEGISPIMIDNLITGYGGPMGTYALSATDAMLNGISVGPEQLPIRSITEIPGLKQFLVDSSTRTPKSVKDAYELFGMVDEVNRTFSRLRASGDAEAAIAYAKENMPILQRKRYIMKMVEALNNLKAQERAIERNNTMSTEEKRAALDKLSDLKRRVTSQVGRLNEELR